MTVFHTNELGFWNWEKISSAYEDMVFGDGQWESWDKAKRSRVAKNRSEKMEFVMDWAWI